LALAVAVGYNSSETAPSGDKANAVTEQEWLADIDPEKVLDWPRQMLEFLSPRASDRKLRLFACGSCRLVWHLLTDGRSRRAVEAAERYADGALGDGELNEAADAAYAAYTEAKVADGYAPDGDVHPEYAGHVPFVAHSTTREVDFASDWALSLGQDHRAQCDLIRCVFGNPFRPVTVDPSWFAWNEGGVQKVARAVYEGRDFDLLPILADALEEAGCDNRELVQHCRSAGPHVRGCWAVDRILGKG
jgi:hypothetical protein